MVLQHTQLYLLSLLTVLRAMPHYLRHAVAGIRLVAATIVVVCFAYMTIAVLAQVFGRYVFNYSISWTEETARFAQAWVILIGAGITMRKGWHVAVDSLPEKLPINAARTLKVILAAGCIWFLGIVVYGSFALIELGWLFESSPVLSIPMWIIYMCLPLGAIYFGIEIILSVIERWDKPFGVIKSSENEIPDSIE